MAWEFEGDANGAMKKINSTDAVSANKFKLPRSLNIL
jgi:hypothetical protein